MTELLINLQLFADGGGASAGDGTGDGAGNGVDVGVPSLPKKGVKNPLADVKYGVQEDSQVQNANVPQVADEDRVAKFEEMIKGEYKDLYDQRMQDTIQKRLKNSKETVDKYNALTPTLEVLAKKYGVDASDVEALNKAIEEDDAYFEDEALEKGITVEQLKEIRRMERENADLKKQMDEIRQKEDADKTFGEWMKSAEEIQQIYPSFDLEYELQNPRFIDLIYNNVDMRTAYEVIHKDEILPAAMQFTAQQVRQKISNDIMANQRRPVEGAVSSQASALVKSDVSQLSKADRQEIIRRVARGEKIRF